MASVIQARAVEKTYSDRGVPVRAVRGVNLDVKAGEFLAIVGPSGSGKTTLLAMIGGLLRPSSGSIRVSDEEISRLSDGERARYRRDRVGYVFQANNLILFLTARENLTIMYEFGPGSQREASRRADALLEELGLTSRAHALARQLSAGERQRVAIARALMRDPWLILVDEPTANLDSERGEQVVRSLIAEVKGREKLGIMVTHDARMAALADVVLEMRDGHLARRERQSA
jgi:putative ABC transport system ATP-binding protein